MKFYYYLNFILSLVVLNNVSANDKNQKVWCWTKSMANEPNFILNKNDGGLNWGFCQQKNDQKPLIKYVAMVTTSQIEKSETSSAIKVTIYGDKGKTKERMFSSSGFERGTEKKVEFSDVDVGEIKKIQLHLVGNEGYRCKQVIFKKENLTSRFECLKRIEPCKSGGDPKKCTLEIVKDGDTPFEVSIKTSDEKEAGTNSPLYIQLIGTNGESILKTLSELGLEKGSSHTVNLNTKDIGEITGYRLKIGSQGTWKPSYLTIKNIVTGMIKNFEINNQSLVSPGSDTITYNPNDTNDSNDTDSNIPKSDSDISISPDTNEEKENFDNNDVNGGLMEIKDKKNIVELTCDQKLLNPSADEILFGPDYPTKNTNYMRILARCPHNCHKIPGNVYGAGIHSDTSSICHAAMIDNAMSYYGGIISISIFPGFESYKIPPKFPRKYDLITVKELSSKSVMKSFTVSKVDNLDLVDRDMRIVDYNGKLSAEGRLEMRVQGKWGTICTLGNSIESAAVICKNLGYKGGEWVSPTEQSGRDFCMTYKGYDYCGARIAPIHFHKIECTTKDIHFNTCNKQLADYKKCNHGFDSIINCFNQVYDTNIPIPNGTIRLDALTSEKNHSFIGRLEMMSQQVFSPICNLGFTNKSAYVACKQMGYNNGEFINTEKKKLYQLEDSADAKFSASGVECRGDERELKNCRMTTDAKCKHDQDVVVMCVGDKGDPTGKSQYTSTQLNTPPLLGKLGLRKLAIKCSFRGNNILLRGDPGSVYLLTCPANCAKEPGMITGTGLYTDDSNICLAAIHSGVIQDQIGGTIAYIKSFGQPHFYSTVRFGLKSSELSKYWSSSFSVSEINSSWLNMNKLFEENLTTEIPKKSSFLQVSKISESSIPKPVFLFNEPSSDFLFKDKSNFIIESHDLSQLSTYSLLTRFKMLKFSGKKQYIFSFSGCPGFNILINKDDSLVIGNICNEGERIETKILIPLNESITLYIQYDKSLLTVVLKSEKLGIIKKEIKAQLEISASKSIGIGRLGQIDESPFFGEINFVHVYDSLLDVSMIPIICNRLNSAKASQTEQFLTVDGRLCVSSCLDIKPGEGSPPEEAKIDGEEDIPNNKMRDTKVVNDGKSKNNADNFGTYDKNNASNQETMQLDCSTNLNDKRLEGSTGKVFRVHCPSCGVFKAVVYGTGIYHPLSPICKAATHAGVIKPGEKSDLIVEITGPKLIFTGSTGVDKSTSGNMSKSDKSFKLRKAKELKSISCETTAGEDVFQGAAPSAVFVVICPEGCSKSKSAEVFGSEIYSDNSSICLSAIHFGVMNDQGGEVQLMIEGEQTIFKSTHGFGIVSKPMDSYIRSFRFLGHKSAISYKFKEDYHGTLVEKWDVNKDNNAIDSKKDEWNFKNEERKTISGKSETFHTIIHSGSVRINDENSVASWISLKAAEFGNGIIKFNLKLIDVHPVGVLFRYTNPENFFMIMFSPLSKNSSIKLISKVNSNIKVIDSKYLSMMGIDVWLRCTLILNFDQMKFLIQQENAREHKLVFEKEIKEISRGSLAFGSNGNNHFYISGLEINEYKSNLEIKAMGETKKVRTFEQILKKITSKDIKGYCGKIYHNKTPNFMRCLEPHTFCQYKCDVEVPHLQEPIINFKCFRDCVKAIYNTNAPKSNNKENNTGWAPKEGMKIDFLVNGQTFFRPGKIVSQIKRFKKQMLKVQYLGDSGVDEYSQIAYPSPNIVKCGEKLALRRDCNDK